MTRAAAALLALLAASLLASPALATTPARDAFDDSFTFDLAAGVVCDFAYHEEDSITGWDETFVDVNGDYVRDTAHIWATIVHTNADTGYTLTESLANVSTFTERTNTFQGVGVIWLLKDASGRVVVAHAGSLRISFDTGEVHVTPNFGPGFSDILCPALGGNPA